MGCFLFFASSGVRFCTDEPAIERDANWGDSRMTVLRRGVAFTDGGYDALSQYSSTDQEDGSSSIAYGTAVRLQYKSNASPCSTDTELLPYDAVLLVSGL